MTGLASIFRGRRYRKIRMGTSRRACEERHGRLLGTNALYHRFHTMVGRLRRAEDCPPYHIGFRQRARQLDLFPGLFLRDFVVSFASLWIF